MSMLNFNVLLKYDYNCTHNEVAAALCLEGDTKKPWIKCLADVFGSQTSSYDGYIRSVSVTQNTINIEAYIVEDRQKFTKLRDLAGINWLSVLSYLIKVVILRAAEDIRCLKSVSIEDFNYLP